MSDLASLHAAIAAVCPIDGVSSDGRIDFKPQATAQQRSDAAAVLAGWDSSPSAQNTRRKADIAALAKAIGTTTNEKTPLAIAALLSLLLDEINLLRQNAGLSQRTLNQLRTAWGNKIDSLVS